MVEEIITALSRIRWLFARNSTFTYKGQPVDVKEVGRELGVRYVLEGSVRKAGQRVRITGQLIDASGGAHLWADRFDGSLEDVFELQDQVASSVVGAIEPKLRQSEIERAVRKPTQNLDAYDLYLRALLRFHKYTAEDVREAIVLLKRALAIELSHAPAAAMIGWCRSFQRVQGWEPVSDAEVAEAVRLARQSIETGKDDPDSLWMGGYTLAYFAGDHVTGLNTIERALMWIDRTLGEQPRLASAVRIKAAASALLDRLEEAHKWAGRLLDLRPGFEIAPLASIGIYAAPEFIALYAEGLRKAGLPEG
jgi:adenylate cyclase